MAFWLTTTSQTTPSPEMRSVTCGMNWECTCPGFKKLKSKQRRWWFERLGWLNCRLVDYSKNLGIVMFGCRWLNIKRNSKAHCGHTSWSAWRGGSNQPQVSWNFADVTQTFEALRHAVTLCRRFFSKAKGRQGWQCFVTWVIWASFRTLWR